MKAWDTKVQQFLAHARANVHACFSYGLLIILPSVQITGKCQEEQTGTIYVCYNVTVKLRHEIERNVDTLQIKLSVRHNFEYTHSLANNTCC